MQRKRKNIFIDYFVMNLGTLITAAGIAFFMAPAKIAAGGVTGLAIIINSILGFPIGLTMLFLNIPLFLIGLKIFGKAYGLKTFMGIVLLSVYVDLLNYLFPHINNLIDFTKGGNLFLAIIYGGLLVGFGVGIILKFGGSTGGTDIVAQIINKYLKLSMGYSMIAVDFIIVSLAAVVFGFEKALYAIITIYVVGIVINKVFEGVSYSRMVYIISDKYEEIRNIIIHDLDSTGNGINIDGLYTNKERKMIMTVMRNKKIHDLRHYIKEVDPNAFVIISEVYEVLGEGFTSIK
jgi:uncharacterized membrane-anchored protein YitT (DUF2179 family)